MEIGDSHLFPHFYFFSLFPGPDARVTTVYSPPWRATKPWVARPVAEGVPAILAR